VALIDKWTAVPGEAQVAGTSPAADKTAAPAAAAADIAFEDFQKLELRVARVTAAERVPKADKLLKLTLDVGGDPRTVVSGIAPAYAPEQMVGKTVIYLANLMPRKIRGVLSQGMILAAGGDEVLALSGVDRDVPPGTPIR
jgi:methionyl-tRNA synthetase